MGKILRLLGTCLTAAFLLGSLPHISQAAEVKAERDIIQTERQDGREFCLRYQVRAEDALGLRKPGRLLIVVDNSLWAADLAEEPLGQAYEEGKPHKAIKEGETLYMEQEGRFLPVSLREGQWKTSGGQTAGERTAQGDVFSCPLYTKGEAQTKGEHIREAVQALLESLVQDAPDTEIGILRAGGRVDVSSVVAAGEGKEVLKAFLEEQKPQGQQNFPAALTLAADLAEESSLPVCLVILAAGTEPLSGEKALLCQSQVQRIRELGGRSFVGVLEDLEKENDAFWQSLASAPGEEHCFFHADPALCLEAAGKHTAGAFQVEIRERLDPRFTLSLPEQSRLEKAGAQVQQAEGMWQVSWPVELYGDRPWEGDLTVEARADFPGGNGVPVGAEGAGVYTQGGQIGEFPPVKANVGASLVLENQQAEIFLGETVPSLWKGEKIHQAMMKGPAPNWYGKGRTGAFSFQWETEAGAAAGTSEELGKTKPRADTVYRLRAIFTPIGAGTGAAGKPVERLEAEGTYAVSVKPGTLRVRVFGDDITQESRLALAVSGPGQSYVLTACPEADPQSGKLVLEAELKNLPYGKYTVTPLGAAGKGFAPQECLLGVCRENDTVDTARRFGVVRFAYRPGLTG